MGERWFYFQTILEGLLIGIPFCLSLGPVMFSVIQNSIEHGRFVGFMLTLGVVVADILLLFIAFSGVENLLPSEFNFKLPAQIIGGLLLIGMALNNILRKSRASYQSTGHKTPWLYFGMGFSINFLNPTNWISWLAIITYTSQVLDYNVYQSMNFFGGIILSVLGTETAISITAHRLKRWLTPLIMRRIHLGTGLIFGGSGLYLLFQSLRTLFFVCLTIFTTTTIFT
jgi:threonine/homoserine/homoserine lactone efflux protein